MKQLLALLLSILMLSACQQPSSGSSKRDPDKPRGVLSEYVNSPLEQAGSADDLSEERNNAQQNVLDQLDEE
jgi:hypothetical protein